MHVKQLYQKAFLRPSITLGIMGGKSSGQHNTASHPVRPPVHFRRTKQLHQLVKLEVVCPPQLKPANWHKGLPDMTGTWPCFYVRGFSGFKVGFTGTQLCKRAYNFKSTNGHLHVVQDYTEKEHQAGRIQAAFYSYFSQILNVTSRSGAPKNSRGIFGYSQSVIPIRNFCLTL